MDFARAKIVANSIATSSDADIFLYCGGVNRRGYTLITLECCDIAVRKDCGYLVLMTYGGDADAAYRIVRALRHYYTRLIVLVPSACKSAGTLLLIGASELVMSDQSELGPLDVQVSKPDEIHEFGSGLDVLQSLVFLQQSAIEHFTTFLMEIKLGSGITAKTAAEIATKLTTGLFQPLYSQIDPARLGELQRAVQIALSYGDRLRADYEGNIKQDALRKLVMGYPSHGFVIDRREARSLFQKVRESSAEEAELGDFLVNQYSSQIGSNTPIVANLLNLLSIEEDIHEVEQPERGGAPISGDTTGAEGSVQSVS